MKPFLAFTLILISSISVQAQTHYPEQDCIHAIPLCQNTYHHPVSYFGGGAIQDVRGGGCLTYSEKNSVWFTFTPQNAGLLEFTITPDDFFAHDIDFALYDLTGKNCADIFRTGASPTRCSFCNRTGLTGISDTGTVVSQNCCDNQPCNFISGQIVDGTETFALIVSNWNNRTAGFTISFTGSVSIADSSSPHPKEVSTPCNAGFLNLQMSEQIFCSTLSADGSEFLISGPGGPFTVTGASAPNCAEYSSLLEIQFTPPLIQGSNYTLAMKNGTDGDGLTDHCGNYAVPGAALSFTASIAPASIFYSDRYCEGTPITLTASYGTGYLWNTGEVTRSITVNPGRDSTYSVTITNGNCIDAASYKVLSIPSPLANFTYAPTAVCAGKPVKFINTTTTPAPHGQPTPAVYLWDFNNSSGFFTGFRDTIHTFDSAGVYQVSLTAADDLMRCSNTITYAVTVSPGDSVPLTIIPSSNVSCRNGDSITLTANGRATYIWSPASTLNASTGSTVIATPTSTTTYQVLGINSFGCTDTVLSTITRPLIIPPSVSANKLPNICHGDNVTLTVNAGYSSFHWNTGASTRQITVTETGSYRVTVTDGNGCTALSAPFNVTVSNPNPVITFNDLPRLCPADSIILNAGFGHSSYQWSTGASSQTITIHQAGIYTVTVTGSTGCTGVSAPVSITTVPDPVPVIIPSGATTFCPGESVVLDAGFGYSNYLWNTLDTTQSIIASQSGVYTVEVTDTNKCNGVSSSIIITTEGNLPHAFFSYTEEGLELTFKNVSANATSYLWDFGDGNTSTDTVLKHQYATEGQFETCLYAINNCGIDTFCMNINISIDAIVSLDNSHLKVYPVPANNTLVIETDYYVAGSFAFLHDITGKLLLSQTLDEPKYFLDLTPFPSGFYFLRIEKNWVKVVKR